MVNSHDSWNNLREVWLGDVYPTSWYDHLAPEVRDCFYEITEKTKQDLEKIQKKLESFGVKVRRPVYDNIDNFLDPKERLCKPAITPRDHCLVSGNNLFISNGHEVSWNSTVEEYRRDPSVNIVKTFRQIGGLSGANVVKVGRDIYIDVGRHPNKQDISGKTEWAETWFSNFDQYFSDYRVHLLANGGHMDGCFSIASPELILANHYYDAYENTFPGWKILKVREDPEFNKDVRCRDRHSPNSNGKFWLIDAASQGKTSKAFNEHVIKHALDWVGDYTETYFETNALSIDQHNIMLLGENQAVFRELEKHGVTVHPVDFRTRTFWDGGMHCLTLDIRRDSTIQDYFPERGDQRYFTYDGIPMPIETSLLYMKNKMDSKK